MCTASAVNVLDMILVAPGLAGSEDITLRNSANTAESLHDGLGRFVALDLLSATMSRLC